MSLLQQIKKDQLQARKSKEALKVKLLTTLLAEAAKPGLDDGKRESTDAEVIGVIKKFIKNANETLKHCEDQEVVFELSILETYLPQQLDEDSLRSIIAANDDLTNVGQIMKFLKDNYNGLYDGKLASTIAKEHFQK